MSAANAKAHRVAGVAVLVALGVAGCRHTAEFIWVDSVPRGMISAETTYRISPGDVIGVRVFNQEASSVERIRVRDDGRISLPLLNDVEVAGAEPVDVARRLEVKLQSFMTEPVVTIVVHERHPLRVSVVGKVVRPGVYEVDRGAGVIHALAAAGGPTPFAEDDGVFLLRSGYWADGDRPPARIRFRYRDLLSGTAPASMFRLHAGDVVVVE